MIISRILASIVIVLVTALAMWITAGLWHNLIIPALYDRVHASHKGIGTLFIAYLILAGIMAYLYSNFRKFGNSIINGFAFGAIIGVLWVFPHELAMIGAHGGRELSYVLKNALWHIFEQGIGGIIMSILILKFYRNKGISIN